MEQENLIRKWLNGELSEAELNDFKKSAEYEQYQLIVSSAEKFKASHFETVDDYETFKAQKMASLGTEKSLFKKIRPFLKIAAAIVVIFGLYMLFMTNSVKTITTLGGEKITVALPDASEVVLNAQSSLAYHEKDWNANRVVNLEGEAFFKVAKGRTFDVIAQQDTIRVLGTEFNVKKRGHYFEVTCYEGSVKVIAQTHERTLAPGDQFLIINNHVFERTLSDTQPNWTQNFSTFTAVPLGEVFDEIERQFNVSITAKNIKYDQAFTGGFQHDNLQNALQAVTAPMNLGFEMTTEKDVIIYEKDQ